MEKTNIIKELTDRITNLEKRLRAKKSQKEDEDVCPECGGNLNFVEDGLVYCPKCKKYYSEEEEEEGK